MSDQLTSQSRLSRGISRRTALRGAAWSASAVTVVVAAPAYAAASTVQLVGALTTSGPNPVPVKYNDQQISSIKHVTWQDIQFTNTGTGALNDLRIVVTLAENSPTDVVFTVASVGGTWTTSGSGTTFQASYSGAQEPLAVGQMLTFTPNFKGANNSAGSMTVEVFSGTLKLGQVSGKWTAA